MPALSAHAGSSAQHMKHLDHCAEVAAGGGQAGMVWAAHQSCGPGHQRCHSDHCGLHWEVILAKALHPPGACSEQLCIHVAEHAHLSFCCSSSLHIPTSFPAGML